MPASQDLLIISVLKKLLSFNTSKYRKGGFVSVAFFVCGIYMKNRTGKSKICLSNTLPMIGLLWEGCKASQDWRWRKMWTQRVFEVSIYHRDSSSLGDENGAIDY